MGVPSTSTREPCALPYAWSIESCPARWPKTWESGGGTTISTAMVGQTVWILREMIADWLNSIGNPKLAYYCTYAKKYVMMKTVLKQKIIARLLWLLMSFNKIKTAPASIWTTPVIGAETIQGLRASCFFVQLHLYRKTQLESLRIAIEGKQKSTCFATSTGPFPKDAAVTPAVHRHAWQKELPLA